MSGTNTQKSEAGWPVCGHRVAARQGVRSAQMDYRPVKPEPESKVVKPLATIEEAMSPDFIVVKGRKRRRVVAPEGKFF